MDTSVQELAGSRWTDAGDSLYYPYVHVRDDAWLKAAALNWPKIGRLAPDGYPIAGSETARKLSGELDFIGSINAEPYALDLLAEFSDFIKENHAALQKRYTVPRAPSPGSRTDRGKKPPRRYPQACMPSPHLDSAPLSPFRRPPVGSTFRKMSEPRLSTFRMIPMMVGRK